MLEIKKIYIRLLFLFLFITLTAGVAIGWVQSDTVTKSEAVIPQAPSAENVTVATTTRFRPSEAVEHGELVAFAPNGSILYYDDQYNIYDGVDPSAVDDQTVTYVAAEHLSADECDASTKCTINLIERVDLRTGEKNRIYNRITPGWTNSRWHDIDHITDDKWLVAGIDRDRVFIVNASSEIITWQWEAQAHFNLSSGGTYPGDWTHINDVELIEDSSLVNNSDLIMVSVRNQDQVIFISKQQGVVSEITLGSEDKYSTLYEQHNPDYIPKEHGGPALLIADSHNNRIIEYKWTGSDWKESYTWKNNLNWPRDADRLPNGHTLIADTNGNRIIEVNRQGNIIWEAKGVQTLYEVERLNTGAESAGGPSATKANLKSINQTRITSERGKDDINSSLKELILTILRLILDKRQIQGILYIFPPWFGLYEMISSSMCIGLVLCWLIAEIYWRRGYISVQCPIQIRDK
jgi:hypothetical protein